jgi:methylase of polypeptide subunit release factors
MKNVLDFLGIQLAYSDEVFRPTLISENCANLTDFKDKCVLDLGCGIGPLAIYFAKNGARQVSACDIFEKHLEFTRNNAKLNEVDIEIFYSDLFSNVKEKYDVICCDVSGVDKRVAEMTGWFPGDVPKADETGSNLILKVLDEAQSFLNEGGNLNIATTSFSDMTAIEDKISEKFLNSEVLIKIEVPFSKRLKENLQFLNTDSYKKIGGDFFWIFKLFKCSN